VQAFLTPATPAQSTVGAVGELHAILTELLAAYAIDDRPLSAWDSYCLGTALTLLRFGYREQARRKVEEILQPPLPLPAFRMPRRLTLEDVRHALHLASLPA
jgi:hypothetical protein